MQDNNISSPASHHLPFNFANSLSLPRLLLRTAKLPQLAEMGEMKKESIEKKYLKKDHIERGLHLAVSGGSAVKGGTEM